MDSGEKPIIDPLGKNEGPTSFADRVRRAILSSRLEKSDQIAQEYMNRINADNDHEYEIVLEYVRIEGEK